MATIADLNIRLGLLTKGFERDLRNMERRLQRSGEKLSRVGDNLTAAISLPLVGIGFAAIKSAGDIEALRLALISTMEGAGRSTAEATAELEALRKVALAPGIDFEQAIKASVRLQSVGISAEDAREQVTQLANAVAAAGGTAQNLDSVTVQFAQMIAKGKVFTQDLKIIKENIPSIGGAMERAFGTQSAEALQEAGISAQEFIKRITVELAKTPRVASGIKNSIVNLFVGLQLEAARLGDEINKAFNVGSLSEGILSFVHDLVDGFASLNDSTKKLIVSAGAFVIALGPMVKAIGAVKVISAGAVGGFASFIKGIDNVIIFVNKAVVAFRALSVAQQAAFLGGAVLAVTLLVEAYSDWNRELTAAQKAQQSVANITQSVSDSISAQKTRVNELVRALEDENTSQEDKKNLLEELRRIAPDYIKDLGLEAVATGELKQAVDDYVNSLIRAETVKQGISRISEIELERERLKQLTQETEDGVQTVINAVLGVTGGPAVALERFNSKFVDGKKALDAEEEAIRKLIEANGGLQSTVSSTTNTVTRGGDASEDAAKKADIYRKALASIQAVVDKGKVLGSDVISEEAKEIENQIERLLENGFKPYSKEVQHLRNLLKGLFADIKIPTLQADISALPTLDVPDQVFSIRAELNNVDLVKQGVKEIESLWKASNEAIRKEDKKTEEERKRLMEERKQAVQSTLQLGLEAAQSFVNFTGALAERETKALEESYAKRIQAAEGNTKLQAALEQELARKREAIRKEQGKKAKAVSLATAIVNVAEGVTKALATFPPPFNLIQAGLVSAAGALQIGTIIAQPLAEGGVVNKPTLALIGEYPGAATDPEIVAPESKLRKIFESGDGATGKLIATVKGDDLQFVLDRAGTRRGRTR